MLSFHCKIVFYIIVISVFYLPTNGFAEIVQGKVESKYANESIIYDWFYYIPTTLNTTETHNILLIAEGGNENYAENSSTVKQIINGWTQFAEENGIIILAASIPRGFDKFGQYHYSVSIPISSFSKETVEPYRRPDEKVNQMIDQLSADLTSEGYSIDQRILIYGFSNEAMFANRYSLLHPERVRAIAVGQCGGYFTMPINSYAGTSLPWAVGIDNFGTLTGRNFNDEQYKTISQYVFIGDEDFNNSHFYNEWGADEDFWSQDQIDFINLNFGDTDPIRLQNQSLYLRDIGYDITFKLYEGLGHSFREDWWNDARNFLKNHKSNDSDVKISVFYKDNDNDGFGDSNISVESDSKPIGYVTDNTDCNDGDSSINPGMTEICNGIDDNCNGTIDEVCSTLEDLSDWQLNGDLGNIELQPDGTNLHINAYGSNSYSWRAREKYFPDAIGISADVSVSEINGTGHVALRKYVGTASSGNSIQARIRVFQWSDEKRISYTVREQDEEGNTIKYLATGNLGNYRGGWSIGEQVTIALARIEDEIWFYTPDNGYTKIEPFESIGHVDSTTQITGYTAEGLINSLEATVSNVSIIYPDNLQVFDTSEASREDIENFVTRFYQLCLNRQPDPAGLAWWADDLEAQKRTGADVARGFINSDEFINRNTTDQEFLNILYEAFFNRDPDQEGLNNWTADLNEGKSREDVLDGFIASDEFAELCQSYGIKAQ